MSYAFRRIVDRDAPDRSSWDFIKILDSKDLVYVEAVVWGTIPSFESTHEAINAVFEAMGGVPPWLSLREDADVIVDFDLLRQTEFEGLQGIPAWIVGKPHTNAEVQRVKSLRVNDDRSLDLLAFRNEEKAPATIVSLSMSRFTVANSEELRRSIEESERIEREYQERKRSENESASREDAKAKQQVVFYSWQSDLDKTTNHYLIRDALALAIDQLSRSRIEDAARPDAASGDESSIALDHDTKNTSGARAVFDVILSKISSCDAFVSDVSFAGRNQAPLGGRWFPNPNVLVETGYAIAHVSWDRMLLIFNDSSVSGDAYEGDVYQLMPFDLRGRRLIRYHSDPNDSKETKKRTMRELASRLRKELEAMLAR